MTLHRSNRRHASNSTLGSLGAVSLLASLAWSASSLASDQAPPAPTPESAAQAPSSEAPPRTSERRRGDRGRFGGGMRWPRGDGDGPDRGPDGPRRLSPEQVERVIETAREVFPEWASRIEELREQDPEGLDRAIAGNARRLFALAMLRDRNPDLYKMKVEELRNQMELRRLSGLMRELAESGDQVALASTREEIRVLAAKHVDLGLRTRATELAAMDEAIRRMRAELEADSLARDAAIDELVAAVEAGRPPSDEDRGLGRDPNGDPMSAPGPRRGRPTPSPE
ncbi:MAG: hypothetical protein RLZZ565_595 [Planctomycetota bacterium]